MSHRVMVFVLLGLVVGCAADHNTRREELAFSPMSFTHAFVLNNVPSGSRPPDMGYGRARPWEACCLCVFSPFFLS